MIALPNHDEPHEHNPSRTKRMQARRLSVVSATACARRRLIRGVVLKMRSSFLLAFTGMVAALNLTSCSCAIVHSVFEAKDGVAITNPSFQAAAADAGLRTKRADSSSYQRRGVYLSYSPEEKIVMHSSFCPTPFTLLTWGADVRAWEASCDEVETSIEDWYAKRGITLQRARDYPINRQAQQGGAQNP